MTSPTQVALRELMILTKCYCEGQRDGLGHPHPQLGHNCSFRPDVMTLVANIGAALKLCQDELAGGGTSPWDHPSPLAEAVHAALLGLPAPADDDPPWNDSAAQSDGGGEGGGTG